MDTDIDFLGKGKCFFHAGGYCKEGGVGGKNRLDSTFLNYHIYCSPRFFKPIPCHRPPLVPCAPSLASCARVPVPLTRDALVASYFPTLLTLDTYAPVILDALAPVFSLGPYLADKPKALSPLLTLGLSPVSFDSHSHVPVTLSWGLTPDRLGPAITAPTTPGPPLSVPSNPGPAAAPTAFATPGPSRRVSTP